MIDQDTPPPARRGNETLYRTISELVSDYAYSFRVEPDGKWVPEWITEGFFRIVGFSPQELLAMDELTELVHPDDRPTLREHTACLLAGEPSVVELRFLTKDGRFCWVRHHTRPEWDDAHSRVVRMVGAGRDITVRKQAEQALRQSEEKYRTIADFAFDWEYWLGPDGSYIYVSPSCERITGYTPRDFQADTGLLHAIVHPDDQAVLVEHWRDELTDRGPFTVEFRIQTRLGEERWISHACQPVVGPDGRWLGRRAGNRDITERVRAEESLRQSEERYRQRSAQLRALYDVSLRLNAQLDVSDLVRLILDQATTLLGVQAGALFLYDPERDDLTVTVATDYLSEFVGMKLQRGEGLSGQVLQAGHTLKVDDYPGWPGRVSLHQRRPRLKALLAAPLIGKQTILGTITLGAEHKPFSDDDVWLAELFAAQAAVALEKARLHDKVQRYAVENARLLQAEREQFERYQATQAQMAHVEKQAAMGRLAAALAHEINNPLQAMQSHLELVMDFPLPGEKRQEFLNVVRQEIARLNGIAQRVLSYARPAVLECREVSVAELVQQTLALAGKQLQHSHIQVSSEVPEGLKVYVAPDQMLQVFLNLVINAIEAIGADGHIWIAASARDDQVVISFADDGQPIPEADLPHIFEPFFTTKPDGTGLGLAVSYNLVEQHGGRLTAQNSAEGRGVIFTVSLPGLSSPVA